jgi:hypothetical protein
MGEGVVTPILIEIENLAPVLESPLRVVTRRSLGDLQNTGQLFQFLFSKKGKKYIYEGMLEGERYGSSSDDEWRQ